MRLINKYVHESYKTLKNPRVFKRTAARAIVLHDDQMLLIYTKRYNDYSIPGGGVDEGEDIKEGLIRELREETGARDIKIIGEYGDYEEYRPTHYKEYDIMHMMSHFYICNASKELGQANPEDYEVANGSVAVWVNIHEAIKHNKSVIKSQEDSMGLSILRETYVLELIAKELL